MSQSNSSRRDFLGAGLGASGLGVAAALGFSRPAAAQVDPETAVTQTAAFKINPEKEAEAIELLRTLTEAVEANEPGVLAYIAHRSQQDPSRLVFYEVYADAEALRAHGQAPHLAPLRQAFGAGVFEGPLEITRLTRVGGYWR